MAPFLRAVLVNKPSHPGLFSTLWFKKRSNHIPLTLLLFLKSDRGEISLLCFAKLLVCSHCWPRWQQQASYDSSLSDWLMGEYLWNHVFISLDERHMSNIVKPC